MSWLPGIASTGRSRLCRNRDARTSWSCRPRWLRSPLAITSSGSKRSIRTGAPRSIASSSPAPKCRSDRWRTRVSTAESGYRLVSVTEESAEIFDDLYLGLRAGGAIRKQRRGEPLTQEEREALGRWQRLSTWRKSLAIGGFALGTVGLGFTLCGLVFRRLRQAYGLAPHTAFIHR